MKFVKNCIDWIPDRLLENLKSYPGEQTRVYQKDKLYSHVELHRYIEPAKEKYNDENHSYQYFNHLTEGVKELNIELPELLESRNNISWWIIKLLPGQLNYVHPDQYLYGTNNPVRYTMFLNDWERGQVFMYDNVMPAEFKIGDLYKWENPLVENCMINIAYNTMYMLQIEMHD